MSLFSLGSGARRRRARGVLGSIPAWFVWAKHRYISNWVEDAWLMEGKLRHIETNSFERQNDSECHIAERMLRDVRGCPPWLFETLALVVVKLFVCHILWWKLCKKVHGCSRI